MESPTGGTEVSGSNRIGRASSGLAPDTSVPPVGLHAPFPGESEAPCSNWFYMAFQRYLQCYLYGPLKISDAVVCILKWNFQDRVIIVIFC